MKIESLWASYSKKLQARIENPRYTGFFSSEEAKERGMRLVQEQGEEKTNGWRVSLFCLVDETDGVIVEARFQAFGPSFFLGACEAFCDVLVRKNYDQARRLTPDFLDRQMRDKEGKKAFPEEATPCFVFLFGLFQEMADRCMDIPISDMPASSPLSSHPSLEGGYPNWENLALEERKAIIEEVIAIEIRPYIELDAGGISILEIRNETEVVIAYEGACTSCHSATGSTLHAIQQILQAKVDPKLTVVPKL